MKITCCGHSCFAVEAAGKTLLFDPFITPNPLAKAIDIKTVRADYILISHGHSDHCADAVEIARQTGATIVSNFEVTQWIAKAGAPNIHPMNHGGSWRLDFGRIQYVNAIHSSSMTMALLEATPAGSSSRQRTVIFTIRATRR
jgi:L-ascorbate metabolism protein UlaG (beta-lactamase superfamily)